MSKSTRREMLETIAAAMLAGPLSAQQARHVHQQTAREAASGGVYHPKALTAHEFHSLERLCELIVPGASKGQAAEFIDLLSSRNPELAAIYTGGLAWLDHYMERATKTTFLGAQPADQTALLDQIAYRRNNTPELAAGI